MREQIIGMARQLAGEGATIRVDDLDPILDAGWDGIELGTVVYRDKIENATQEFTKTGENEITTNSGQKVIVDDKQKINLLAVYALISIVGHKKN